MALWGLGLGWRWLALLLDLAGWIVYLIGLALLQKRCSGNTGNAFGVFGQDGGVNTGLQQPNVGFNSAWNGVSATNRLIGTSDYFGTPRKCSYLYSFPWYLFAYQFFLVVLYAILHTRRSTYGTSKAALAALTAYGLYLATKVTDIFFHIRFSAYGAPGDLNGPVKAAFAGALIMGVAKGLLLLGLLFPHEDEEATRTVTKVEATTYASPPQPSAVPLQSHV